MSLPGRDLVIWKYPLEARIRLPSGAKILTVGTQLERPYVWCLCDPEVLTENRTFVIVATGDWYDRAFFDDLKYVGTYQQYQTQVWHVFERRGEQG